MTFRWKSLKDFEPQMIAFIESKYQDILSEIKEKKEISHGIGRKDEKGHWGIQDPIPGTK